VDEITNAYNNDELSTVEKKIEIAAQAVFLSTQATEVALMNHPQVLTIVNCVNGIAAVVKTGVHGHIHDENPSITAFKIA